MDLDNVLKLNDVGSFFICDILDSILPSEKKKSGKDYFIKRRDFNKRMAQKYCFSKDKSKKIIDFLIKGGFARNGNRGITIKVDKVFYNA